MEEYPLFVSDTNAFAQRLEALINLKGKAVVDGWKDALSRGDVSSVVHSLLESHYDPTYLKSISRNFRQHTQALVVSPRDRHSTSFDALAESVVAQCASVT
jgi:tRNA 2-selenouridine synthase